MFDVRYSTFELLKTELGRVSGNGSLIKLVNKEKRQTYWLSDWPIWKLVRIT